MGQILTYKFDYKQADFNWSVADCKNFKKLYDYLKPNSILLINSDKLTHDGFRFLINAKLVFNDLQAGFKGKKFPCPGFFTDLNRINTEEFIQSAIRQKKEITDKRLLLKSVSLLNKKSILKNNNLLIFDMDGTVLKSDEYSIEAIHIAMKDLFEAHGFEGEPVSLEKIHSFIGAPHEEFYKGILPPELKEFSDELHKRVFVCEADLLPEKGKCFPTAEETLTQLKNAGYKMTMASNCSYDYFRKVIDTLKLERFFENPLCIGQRRGKSKADLIEEHKKFFKARKAVFFGDRIYDIEAGLNTDCFTTGAEFGYGKSSELYYSHYRCEKFSDLLNVLD
ncbi:MAG: hypothetical protein CSB55_04835 [Candidatus Cloacimonadota bacterium]|nr:MAG: hypothetical protein CSB55_04835 [Candidatus Cloacimonadota bacterium]